MWTHVMPQAPGTQTAHPEWILSLTTGVSLVRTQSYKYLRESVCHFTCLESLHFDFYFFLIAAA